RDHRRGHRDKLDYSSIVTQGYTSCAMNGNGIYNFNSDEYASYYSNISSIYDNYLNGYISDSTYHESLKLQTKLLFQELLINNSILNYSEDSDIYNNQSSIKSILHILDQMNLEDTVTFLNYLRADNISSETTITDNVFVPIIESCIYDDGFIYLKGAIYEWNNETETYSFKEIVIQSFDSGYGINGMSMVLCVVFRTPAYFKKITLNFGDKDFTSNDRYLIYFNNINSNNGNIWLKPDNNNIKFLDLLESTNNSIDDAMDSYIFTPSYAEERLYELYLTPNFLSTDSDIKIVNIEKRNQSNSDHNYTADDEYIYSLSYDTSYNTYYTNRLIYEDFDYTDITTSIIVDGIEYVIDGNNLSIIGSSYYQTTLVIPSEVTYEDTTYSVTSIGSYAFGNLTSVNIPSSVTTISDYAFYACSKLSEVVVNWLDVIPTISNNVFSTYSSAILYVPDNTLSLYSSKDNWNSFNSMVFIGVFGNLTYDYDNVNMTVTVTGYTTEPTGDITLPSIVTDENGESFDVTSIADGTTTTNGIFYGCTGLTSITLPESLTSIGDNAFRECSALESVTFDGDSQLTTIGDYTFHSCTNLSSIEIPTGVTEIGDSTFYNCYALTSIDIPDGVSSIGSYIFYYCTSLTTVDMSEDLTTIGSHAFYNCESLSTIEIPSGVTEINYYTFYNCTSLTSIEIPAEVTEIGHHAFYNCSSLESVTVNSSTAATIGDSAFGEISESAVLYVPAGSTDTYEGVSNWNTNFDTIVELTN
ncbi:MAG: leucine-rich repeat protein, partial [Bacteroidales bacterium]